MISSAIPIGDIVLTEVSHILFKVRNLQMIIITHDFSSRVFHGGGEA